MAAYGEYAPKKSNTGLIIGIVIGAILLCCIGPLALVGGGGYYIFNKSKALIVCGMAYNDVWQAVDDYARDHHGKLPDADKWMDEIRPYYRKIIVAEATDQPKNPFGQMPAEGAFGCTSDSGQTGMAFNKDASGKSLDNMKDRSTTVVVFETDAAPSMNLNAKYSPLPMSSSPKIMNSPRGWFTVNAEGHVMAGQSRFNKGFNGQPQITPAGGGGQVNVQVGTTGDSKN